MESVKQAYPVGSTVQLLTHYAGPGHFVADGFEGVWLVVGHVGNDDLKVSRDGGNWELIVHRQRVNGDHCASWRPDSSNYSR